MFHSNKRVFALVALAAGAAVVLAGCASGGDTPEAAPTFDPDAEVTLDFAFWGNDIRAEMYNEAIAAFNEEYPNITVNPTFLAWDEYWEKRQTEAAGKNLPDVFQMDMTYVRQYSENGLLLDLTPYAGDIIATDGFDESVLNIASINDEIAGMPVSTNAIGMFENVVLTEKVGVDPFEGGDWGRHTTSGYMTHAMRPMRRGSDVWGGNDPTSFIQPFELVLRSEGKSVFTEDGEVGFTEEDLADFWSRGAPLREDGVVTPQQRLEEVSPKGGFDSANQLTEIVWDNFGAPYLANLGDEYPELNLVAPPVTKEGAKDLYKKAGMLISGAAAPTTPRPPRHSSTSWSTAQRWARSSERTEACRLPRPSSMASSWTRRRSRSSTTKSRSPTASATPRPCRSSATARSRPSSRHSGKSSDSERSRSMRLWTSSSPRSM